MVDRKALQNLNLNDQIVDPKTGTPTQFFMRLLQTGNGITDDITTEVNDLRSINIETDTPIEGGPYSFADHVDGDPPLTISHAVSDVIPTTYGDTGFTPKITVDEWGHVTDAEDIALPDGSIAVDDEGTPVAGGPFTVLNFTGAGVTATDAGGGVANITIPGGGSGGNGVVAKAFVSFSGAGVITLIGATNVASVVRNAVGDFTATFTSAIPANCAALASGRFDDFAAANFLEVATNRNAGKGVTTTTFDFLTMATGIPFDPYNTGNTGAFVFFEIIDPTAF